MPYKRKSSRELCGMGQGALLMYAQDLQIEIERLQAKIAKIELENAELRERIKELISGDAMHEPNWSNCNEA